MTATEKVDPPVEPVPAEPVGEAAHSRRRVAAWRDRTWSDSLARNSVLIMATTVVNASLGYVYWVSVGRTAAAATIGLATAALSALALVSLVTNPGLHSAMISRLPGRRSGPEWSATLIAGLFLAAGTGLVGGLAAALVLPVVSGQLHDVGRTPRWLVLFPVTVALWSAVTVLDRAFIAERAAQHMLVRNGMFGIAKLMVVLLAVVLGRHLDAFGILVSWAFAAIGSLVFGIAVQSRWLCRSFRLTLDGVRNEMVALRPSLLGQHLTNLGSMAPLYLLPLVIVARRPVREAGFSYIAWMIGGLFLTVSPAVAESLFAEGSHASDALAAIAWRATRVIFILLIPLMAFIAIFGHRILEVFGPEYAHRGGPLLLVLVISAVPDAVTNVTVSVLRVRRRLGLAAALNLGMAFAAVVLAWVLLPHFGIIGAGLAWLAAQTAGAVLTVPLLRARSAPVTGRAIPASSEG